MATDVEKQFYDEFVALEAEVKRGEMCEGMEELLLGEYQVELLDLAISEGR